MPSVNTLFDTPVRHHDESMTNSSVLLRLHRPKTKSAGEKANRNIEEIQYAEKAEISLPSKISTQFLDNQPMDTRSHSQTDNDVSVIKDDETNITSCEDMSSTKNDVEEEVLISKEKHSTPRDVKVRAKAVSSTPNQEILSSTRLRRSVASQTILTLNGREFNEFDDDLKSFIIEVPEERNESVAPNICRSPHSSEGSHCLTSPLRSLCTSKLANLNTPIENKKMNVRKLSLRSKTMITSAIEKSKDMLPRYKSLEEKRIISNTFSLLPHPKTPPPCSEKVTHNPFEADLSARLGKSIFSPDVFDNVLSPSEDSEYLRWTIEDISSINPVPIEEDFTLPSDDEDAEKESQVQEEIERYFSETHLVLSPDELFQSSNISQCKRVKHQVRAAASTPQKVELMISREFKNGSTQTALSLPETLPSEFEDSLRNFFQFVETDDFNFSTSNLRRKLFFHSDDEPPSPVRFEIRSSPLTKDSWDSEYSPYAAMKKGRHFTPLGNQGAFSSPEMSPVLDEPTNVELKSKLLSSCKKTLYHYFSGNNQQCEEEKKDLHVSLVENSTVIMIDADSQREMVVDSSIMIDTDSQKEMIVDSSSSALPSSQDTGYHTEESWQHCNPFSMMASTPTRPTH